MTESPCIRCIDAATPCPCPIRLQWEAVTYPDPEPVVCLTCVDVEWLTLAGELPDQVAARLGYGDRRHLYDHLRRHGTNHLIRPRGAA